MKRRVRWSMVAAVIGVGIALRPSPVFASGCLSKLDCSPTPGYFTATSTVAAASAVIAVVIAVLAESTSGAASAPPTPLSDSSRGVILDGSDALTWLAHRGLITPVFGPDNSVSWRATSDDLAAHPDLSGITWDRGENGEVSNPVIVIAGVRTPSAPPPPRDEPPPPAEPPPPEAEPEPEPPPSEPGPEPEPEPEPVVGYRAILQLTSVGRDALRYIAENNIRLSINDDIDGGQVSAHWDWQNNTIVVNNSFSDEWLASTIIHETEHARRDAAAAAAITLPREDYIEHMLRDEVACVLREVAHNWQLLRIDPTRQRFMPFRAFDFAAREARRAHLIAHADALRDQLRAAGEAARRVHLAEHAGATRDQLRAVDRAARRVHLIEHSGVTRDQLRAVGQAAGRARIRQMFDDGTFTTSNTQETYPEYYGRGWDAVNASSTGN